MRRIKKLLILIMFICIGVIFFKPVSLYIEELTGVENITDIQTRVEEIFVSGTGTLDEDSSETPENTGEEYEFDEDIYIYRTMLSDDEKEVYNQIYSNAVEHNESFTLVQELSEDEIERVMTAVYNDHPELFWVDTKYSYGYTFDEQVVSITLNFNSTEDDIDTNEQLFDDAIDYIVSEAQEYETDYEKEKFVHDYFVENVVYDEDASISQSAFSAVVNGESVCAGYSRAFQCVMTELGIPCYYCAGYAMGNSHAWNVVIINEKAYNVDLSWDDSDSDNLDDLYKYFNVPDSVIEKDHVRAELSKNLPECISDDLSISN